MTDYLIFGGTGSLGQKLINRLLPAHSVAVYSRDEAKHWTIHNSLACGPLADRLPRGLFFYVGDVRDQERVRDVIRQSEPKTIIVASALKQVDTCEVSPGESILTNIVGIENVVNVVNEINPPSLQHLLLVSTDKACAPVNVYGMCKAIAERMVTSQARTGLRRVKYLAVRYGNVLESRGSIIPLFRHQADHAPAFTVTDPNMTRFVMTLDQSVDLIERTLECGQSGETWIPRLPSMRIGDLADLFAERVKKPIEVIGLRPGEKMHEDLINESESPRARLDGDAHYIIGPAFLPGSGKQFVYTSADSVMSRNEVAALLARYIDLRMDRFPGRSIEEIAIGQRST